MATLDGVFTALMALVKEHYDFHEVDPSNMEKDVAGGLFRILKEKVEQGSHGGISFHLPGRRPLNLESTLLTGNPSSSSSTMISSGGTLRGHQFGGNNGSRDSERPLSSASSQPSNANASSSSIYSTLLSRPYMRPQSREPPQPSGLSSPFYSGRTTFGGASASRRSTRLASSNPYNLSQRNAPSMKVQVKNNKPSTGASDNLSTAAKRILESMEKNSPQEAAKSKLAPIEEKSGRESMLRRNLNVGHSRQPTKQTVPQPYFTQNKNLSEIGKGGLRWDLLKDDLGKQKLPEESTAGKSIAAASQPTVVLLDTPPPSQEGSTDSQSYATTNQTTGGGKMARQTKSSGRAPLRSRESNENYSPVDLPAVALSLPVSNQPFTLPLTSFQKQSDLVTSKDDNTCTKQPTKTVSVLRSEERSKGKSSAPAEPAFSTSVGQFTNISEQPPSKKASHRIEDSENNIGKKNSLSDEFMFSSPIEISGPTKDNSVGSVESFFTFSSPIALNSTRHLQSQSLLTKNLLSESPVPKDQAKLESLNESIQRSESAKKNEPIVASPASMLKSGSVLDALNSFNQPAAPKTSTPKKLEEAAVPTTASEAPLAPLSSSNWGDAFKPKAGTWSCDVCLVSGIAADKSKCPSCESDNPNAPSSTSSVCSGFGQAITSSTTSSMTTSKPATQPSFSFGNSNATFGGSQPSILPIKFGASASSLATSGDVSSGKSGSIFAVASTQESKVTAVTGPSFSFGAPSAATAIPSKPAFVFGPSSVTPQPSLGFNFGSQQPTPPQPSSFGQTAVTSTPIVQPFAFVQNQNPPNTIQAAPSFNFGQQPTNQQPAPGQSLFSFNVPQVNPASGHGLTTTGVVATTPPSISNANSSSAYSTLSSRPFMTPQSCEPSQPCGTSSPFYTGRTTFGGASGSSPATFGDVSLGKSGSTFGASSVQENKATAVTGSGFSFGALPGASVTPSKPAFVFGSTSVTPQPSLGFNFGTQQPTPSQPGFNFGQTTVVPTPIAQPFAFGQNQNPPDIIQTPPSFNFGQQQSSVPGQALFTFNAPPVDPASGNGPTTTRVVKKAKRRLGGPS